ncbi:MAG: GNAT family N-acetyltransferase [Gemmatimonadota bacterium]
MPEFTPDLQLQTLYSLNGMGRIVSTREPNSSPGPRFSLIRAPSGCAWSVHAEIPDELAIELGKLAADEPRIQDFELEPVHARHYTSLLGGRIDAGPAFTFPEYMAQSTGLVEIRNVGQLERYFRGWTEDELPGRAPILAITEGEDAISICYCARLSPIAAEAGVDTAEAFRGRRLAGRVTAAWVSAIRASGRLPIYSTSWGNAASRAVARRLRLELRATDWSIHA